MRKTLVEVFSRSVFTAFVVFFINSIAALPDEAGSFVSVGEDRTLRIWKGVWSQSFNFTKFNTGIRLIFSPSFSNCTSYMVSSQKNSDK